jgi:hypothetical protein
MASISGNTIFITVTLVLATLLIVNTMRIDNQAIVEEKMMEYRTEELGINIEMVSDFSNPGYMTYEMPQNYTVSFRNVPTPPTSSGPRSELTLSTPQRSASTYMDVELQSEDTFNTTAVCIRQDVPIIGSSRRTLMSNAEFVRQLIDDWIESACSQSGIRNYPSDRSTYFKMEGVEKMQFEYHDQAGSDWMTVDLKYGDGSVDAIRIDSVGAMSSWDCGDGFQGSLLGDSPEGRRTYQFNGSLTSDPDSGVGGEENNNWVNVDPNKVTKWRVMEEKDNHWVNVQVSQPSAATLPGDELVNITRGQCNP